MSAMPPIPRYVITGTGRCGTSYCAAVLNACGIKASHQTVFDHYGVLGLKPIEWKDVEVACSFQAVPILSDWRGYANIILLVRDPLEVARSFLELGLFGDDFPHTHGLFYRILTERFHLPWHRGGIETALTYWLEWNREALRSAHQVMLTRNLSPTTVLKAVGREYDPTQQIDVPTDCNNRSADKKRRLELCMTDIDRDLRAHLEADWAMYQGLAMVNEGVQR